MGPEGSRFVGCSCWVTPKAVILLLVYEINFGILDHCFSYYGFRLGFSHGKGKGTGKRKGAGKVRAYVLRTFSMGPKWFCLHAEVFLGVFLGIAAYKVPLRGGSAMNCYLSPPLNRRWLCKRPGSVFVQNY